MIKRKWASDHKSSKGTFTKVAQAFAEARAKGGGLGQFTQKSDFCQSEIESVDTIVSKILAQNLHLYASKRNTRCMGGSKGGQFAKVRRLLPLIRKPCKSVDAQSDPSRIFPTWKILKLLVHIKLVWCQVNFQVHEN